MQTPILQESNYKEEMQSRILYLSEWNSIWKDMQGRRSTVCIMFRRTHMRL